MKKKRWLKGFKHISPLPTLEHSGFFSKRRNIEIAKKHTYTIIKDIAITGDAPKDIIRLYEYGKASKNKYKKWPIYIAKLGHKYYPLESVTEQLMTDIGISYGFQMAKSKLCLLGGQIRFLSLYFIDHKGEELYHGADMYAGYLNDKPFIDEIEEKKETQSFFTIKFTKEVLEHTFGKESQTIFISFMKMLFFDALVGNNDRHMYNWGVARSIFGERETCFSPIYDSARGLLWNEKEDKLHTIISDSTRCNNFIKKYSISSRPKIGVENEVKINHFALVKKYKEIFCTDKVVIELFENDLIRNIEEMINLKYKELLSEKRRFLIIEILKYRYFELKKNIKFVIQMKSKLNKILNKLTPWSLSDEYSEHSKLNINEGVFILSFKEKIIGVLEFKDDKWTFKYSEEYKRNQFILPLIDFPDIEKEYEFDELMPFFATRIPNLNQPFHFKKIEKYKKEGELDIVKLLEIFGQKSINNPFELKYTTEQELFLESSSTS